ncbi:MAG: hypothetical protein J5724_02480 [Ruminococcus sp.]|nr:hypothetical protein [Ruminococcus sp.]
MKKTSGIKTALSLAVILFSVKLIIDLMTILCDPVNGRIAELLGRGLKDAKLPAEIKTLLVLSMLIAIVPKLILAAYNRSKPDLIKQRGIITIILSAVFGLLISLISILLAYLTSRLVNSAEVSILLSSTNMIRSYTGFLTGAANIILYCCGAVEAYVGERNTTIQ